MGYFYAIFAFADRPVVALQTNLTRGEFFNLWTFHSDIRNDSPLMEYAPGQRIDTWEHYSDKKIYLSASAALGSGGRERNKIEGRARRVARADATGCRRKKIQYKIIDRHEPERG